MTVPFVAGVPRLLPRRDVRAPEPDQVAALVRITAGSRGGDAMLARIGVMKALNRHVERVFDPDRKETHWGKRKLKRDQ
jgi:hypothetical protein